MKRFHTILLIAAMLVSGLVFIGLTSTAYAAQQQTATISSVAAGNTPTDTEPPPAIEPPADTDNATGDGCVAIVPSEIELSATGPVTTDVNILLVREDLPLTLTKEDLRKLEITVNDSCAGAIIVNTATVNADADPPTISANITIAPEAAGTECSIQIADPQGIADPPLNCEGVISFTASEEPGGDCALTEIRPASVVGLKVAPRVVQVKITGNENASFSSKSTLSFDGSGITPLFVFAKDAQTIYATVLVWGAEKGQYAVSVDGCSGVSFEVK